MWGGESNRVEWRARAANYNTEEAKERPKENNVNTSRTTAAAANRKNDNTRYKQEDMTHTKVDTQDSSGHKTDVSTQHTQRPLAEPPTTSANFAFRPMTGVCAFFLTLPPPPPLTRTQSLRPRDTPLATHPRTHPHPPTCRMRKRLLSRSTPLLRSSAPTCSAQPKSPPNDEEKKCQQAWW